MEKPKPWYVPDTQGFLAVAIIVIISAIILILLLHPLQITDTVNGVLMTLIGVLAAELKDVYAFYFNSTSSSKTKDETIKTMAATVPEALKAAPAVETPAEPAKPDPLAFLPRKPTA